MILTKLDRDASHGVQHMYRVMQNANNIFELEKHLGLDDEIHRIVLASAMLHDEADHKYLKGNTSTLFGKLKVELIELDFTEDETELVLNICDNVSFSKEFNGEYDPSVLLTKYKFGEIARNIVSDADKLEALGLVGIRRCWMYSTHKLNENYKHKPTYSEVKLGVTENVVRETIGHGTFPWEPNLVTCPYWCGL